MRGGLLHADEHAEGGALALDHAAQVAHVRRARVAGLDAEDDLLGLRPGFVVKVEAPVDALVGARLLLRRAGAHQPQRPPLELPGVGGREGLGVGHRDRLADDLVVLAGDQAERVLEPRLDERDRQMRDVDADPATAERLRRDRRRAAAAEGVEDDVALVGRGADDAFQQRLGLLRRVAEALALSAQASKHGNVHPEILHRHALALVKVALLVRHARLGVHQPSGVLQPLHVLVAVAPVTSHALPLVVGIAFCSATRSGDVCLVEQPARLWLDIAIPVINGCLGKRQILDVERLVRALDVEEQDIVHSPEVLRPLPRIAVRVRALPNDLVHVAARSENRIHQELQIVAGRRVAVQVDAAGGLEHAAQLHEARGHHRKVGEHVAGAEQRVEGLQGLAHLSAGLDGGLVAPLGGQVPRPRIFERLDLAGRLLAAMLGKEHVVGGVAVERRVEVDEVD